MMAMSESRGVLAPDEALVMTLDAPAVSSIAANRGELFGEDRFSA
jgi:hypothetical protein